MAMVDGDQAVGNHPMSVVIIDSGGANLGSVEYALERLGVKARVSNNHDVIRGAQRIILPGVGAAGDAMRRLRENQLDQLIPTLKQPLLGICLGLQLLYESSAENDEQCLGIFPGRVEHFPVTPDIRIPHMGWNHLQWLSEDEPLRQALGDEPWTYFVHSYFAPVNEFTIARCEQGLAFSAIARRDNFLAAQFHPERSARAGAALLRYFLECP